MQRSDKVAILFKIETVEGTDPVPTGGANAILARNVTFDPNPSTLLARPLVKPTHGQSARPIAGRHATVSFDVELAGSGTVAVAPAWGPVARACGFAETIIPTTGPVEYDPVSSGYESAGIYFNMDGVNHAMLMCRGSAAIVVEPNEVPMLRCTMTGLNVNPAAAALPTSDFAAFQTPLPAGNDNTPTFTLHGYAAILRSLTIDMAQRVVFRDLVNAERVDITGREPTGSLTIEAPPIGTQDFYAVERAETLAALQLVHGTVANNIVTVDAPAVQIHNPRYEEADGIAYMPMDLNVAENTGDDEVKITVS